MNDEDIASPPNEILGSESASTQQAAKPDEAQSLVPVSNRGGITQLPLTDTLKEIRQINSQAAMMLLCTHASKLESDLQDIKKERNDAQQKSEKWMQAYYGEGKKCAVLSTQLRAVSSKKNLQKLVGAIGALISGVAIPFIITESAKGWGIATAIIGVALLIAGFWPSEFKQAKE